MKPDRGEIQDIFEKQSRGPQLTQMSSMLNKMEQAAINAENLTQDNNWNIYLQMLQAWVEHTKNEVKIFTDQLSSPEIVNPDLIFRLKNYIIMCQERIAVLESVIALPVQIMDAGEQAKLELEKIGGEKQEKDNIDNS